MNVPFLCPKPIKLEAILSTVHRFSLNGLPLQTGDLICTTDGLENIPVGEFWRLLGRMVPGPVDHIVIYIGPGGHCVEAGPRGVNEFDIPGDTWDAMAMLERRGPLVDQLYGVAYPLAERGLSPEQEKKIRIQVGRYCLRQARLHKPYNINYLNTKTQLAFYCSQLAYRAYLPHGIDLNTGLGVPDLRGSEQIVFPQEIWEGCQCLQAL